MKKVIVIGCPGSGKSVFSGMLHEITGLPLYHLDMLYWNSDETTVEREIFLDRLKAALDGESFIIDGNYASTMDMRMRVCDTVIFLDYDRETCLDGINKRRGKPRPDMPWVESLDRADEEFIQYVRTFNETNRPQIITLLEKYKDKEIHIFKDRSEGDAFLDMMRREKTS